MTRKTPFAAFLLAIAALVAATAPAAAATPARQDGRARFTPAALAAACAGRQGYGDAAPPARIANNTWYVGTCGISAILVTSPAGHVLIDGGPASNAPLVLANIAALGFRARDIRWLLSSHEHYDHVGALAALHRATGAPVAALSSAVATLESGKPAPDDPQAGAIEGFAPVHVDRVLHDGDTVRVGSLVLTIHATPAHSPGSASWTWRRCASGPACRTIAYADSATTISADGYRFSDHPDRVAKVRAGLATIAGLPCDLLITPHPGASDMFARFAGKAPLAPPGACKAYAQKAQATFAARLAKEAAQ